MLVGNVVACFFFGSYFYGMGEPAATLALLIAGSSSVAQALIPARMLDKTLPLRLGIAVLMACLSIAVVYQGPSDILPLAAVVMVRFSESFKTQQMMRLGNLIPTTMWIGFGTMEGLYLVVIGDVILLLSYLLAIYREEQARRQALLVPAE